MHYKIEKSGCVEHKGLCQVRADFYHDETDKDYALTDVKIVDKPYDGEVNEMGMPKDIEAYQKWYDSLTTEKRLLPFHTHFIYFDHDVTDEEILFCFEIAKSWLEKNEPMKNVKPVWKPSLSANSVTRISAIKATDFMQVSDLYSVK